jgi:hypothetical protein
VIEGEQLLARSNGDRPFHLSGHGCADPTMAAEHAAHESNGDDMIAALLESVDADGSLERSSSRECSRYRQRQNGVCGCLLCSRRDRSDERQRHRKSSHSPENGFHRNSFMN